MARRLPAAIQPPTEMPGRTFPDPIVVPRYSHCMIVRCDIRLLGGARVGLLGCTLLLIGAVGCRQLPFSAARRIRHVDSAILARAASDSLGDWLTYGRDYDNSRFVPQRRIRQGNVDSLTLRMTWRTGAGITSSFETSPLVVSGIMYVTTQKQEVVAFDLRRQREIWRYRHRSTERVPLCCGAVNRGAAMGYGMIFFGTQDAHLIALDALSGRERWVVRVDSPKQGHSITMAPLLVDSLVVIGTAGGEFGIRGHVSAYNATSGALVWRWYTVPAPAEGGWWGRWTATTPTGEKLGRDLARERADSARYSNAWQAGGGAVWTTPAYDPVSHRLFLGIGNPWPEFDGSVRPGDNLYTSSIVALDARTGRLVWYHQCVPHDVWEMDVASSPAVVRRAGRTFVVQAGKTGWLYVLDADDGSLVSRSDAFVPQEHMFANFSTQSVVIAPGSDGGANWSPVSYSPALGYVYVVGSHEPNLYVLDSSRDPHTNVFRGHTARTAQPEWGTITAIEVPSGRTVWQVRTEQPMVGGSIATAGGLVFTGEGNGWFRAYDAATGKELWGYRARFGVDASPGQL